MNQNMINIEMPNQIKIANVDYYYNLLQSFINIIIYKQSQLLITINDFPEKKHKQLIF